MNKLLIYSVIVVVGAGVTAFVLIANVIFNHALISGNNPNPKAVSALVIKPLEIKIKSITVNKTSDKTATLGIIFGIHNPNQNTILLDGIQYNLLSNNLPIVSGEIGTETQLDVVRGQSSFPIIGNSAITLKDTNILHRNNVTSGIWDKLVEGKATYVIKGLYSTKQTADFDYATGSNEFNSTYP